MLTKHDIEKLLSYDPNTGVFRWIANRRGTKHWKCAGSVPPDRSKNKRYCTIGIFGKTYLAHRLAILMMTGEWPPIGTQVDHIDGNRQNNCWSNLRVVTRTVNLQNSVRSRSGSRSKLIGAHWCPTRNNWQARIRVNGKQIYLGSFKTAEQAHATYMNKKRELHIGFMGI